MNKLKKRAVWDLYIVHWSYVLVKIGDALGFCAKRLDFRPKNLYLSNFSSVSATDRRYVPQAWVPLRVEPPPPAWASLMYIRDVVGGGVEVQRGFSRGWSFTFIAFSIHFFGPWDFSRPKIFDHKLYFLIFPENFQTISQICKQSKIEKIVNGLNRLKCSKMGKQGEKWLKMAKVSKTHVFWAKWLSAIFWTIVCECSFESCWSPCVCHPFWSESPPPHLGVYGSKNDMYVHFTLKRRKTV